MPMSVPWNPSRWYGRLAVVLAAVVTIAGIPVPAAGPASLRGVVVRAEGADPIAGARVHVADPESGEIVSSEPTATNGAFEVAGLAARSYELGIEVDGGLYVVARPLEVTPDTPPLRLAVGAPSDVPGSAPIAPALGRSSVWDRPLTATLLILGIAAATALAVDQIFGGNDEKDSSPTGGT